MDYPECEICSKRVSRIRLNTLVIGVVKSFAAPVIPKAKSLSTRKGRFAGNAKVPTIKSSLISLEFFGPKK